ncbi:hypothetical protein D3C84_581990 [compost metagenome]
MLRQGLFVDRVQRRQRVPWRYEQGDLRAFVEGRAVQVGGVAVLHLGQGDMRAATLHQGDQVIALGNQAFELKVRVALFEAAQCRIEPVGMIGIGKRHRQLGLYTL